MKSGWMAVTTLSKIEGVAPKTIIKRAKDGRPFRGVYYEARPVRDTDKVHASTLTVYQSVRPHGPTTKAAKIADAKERLKTEKGVARGGLTAKINRLESAEREAESDAAWQRKRREAAEAEVLELKAEIIRVRGQLDDAHTAYCEAVSERNKARRELRAMRERLQNIQGEQAEAVR